MTYLPILISFITTLILIPFLKKFGIKKGFCDNPEGDKLKIHKKPTPYLGGVGIFLGFAIGLVFSRLIHTISGVQATGVIIGSIVILFLGFWDDFKWRKLSSPILKLFCQFLAGAFIVFVLIQIGVNFNFSISPVIGALIAGFYVIGAMNTINMQDGLDGLAGGIVSISLMGFIYLSIVSGNSFSLILALSLLGAILGFLIYNFKPASIFMGDNGSHFLGFLIAVLAISFTGHPGYNFKEFIGPILIIGLPIIDTFWAIIRRIYKGRSPLQGDRSHIYDRLNQSGLNTVQTVLICYGIQIIIVLVGLIVYL